MTLIDDDYRPGDEYDWDQSRDDQHCEHGTFIGSWWGPDLMCQWCEGGVSVAEMHAYYAAQRQREYDKAVERWDGMAAALTEWHRTFSNPAGVLHNLVHDVFPSANRRWIE